MKVAKLVYVNLLTRVVVNQNATEQEIMELAIPKLSEQLMDSPLENIEKIVNDLECPYNDCENNLSVSEGNILIAEFLGFQKTKLGWFDNEEVLNNVDGSNTFDFLLFDCSWEWVMSAAKICKDIADDLMLHEWSQSFEEVLCSFSKKDIYNEIVNFILFCKKNNL
jgi:hypothetical protein